MSLTSLSISDLITNVCNAFVSTLSEIGGTGEDDGEQDATLRTLMKENRYMYLALLVLVTMVIANIFFTTV